MQRRGAAIYNYTNMIDIQNPLNYYLLQNLPLNEGALPVITNDLFLDAEGLAVCCAPSPSNAYERKHLDGSVMGKRFFDYRCRSQSAGEARLILEFLLEIVDDLELEIVDGVAREVRESSAGENKPQAFFSCEAVSAPVFLGLDDKGQSVYQCSISVTYNN